MLLVLSVAIMPRDSESRRERNLDLIVVRSFHIALVAEMACRLVRRL